MNVTSQTRNGCNIGTCGNTMARMKVGPVQPLVLVLLAALAVASTTQLASPPTLVKQPPHEMLYTVSGSIGETDRPFVLECEAEGNPEPAYKWTKNGREFDHTQQDNRIRQKPHAGSLTFIKPSEEDEGLYECQATNLHGTSVSNSVWVRKAEIGESADGPPKVVRAVERAPLSLECEPPVGGYPRPRLFWVIVQANGALRNVISARITVDPEGRLHFSWAELDDQLSDAVYACTAASEFRHEYKFVNKVQLQVESVPGAENAQIAPVQQYVSPPNITALRGHKLRLYCIYGGSPLPQISWTKQGTESLTPAERYAYDNVHKTMEIKSVSFEDEGTYECQASNGAGPDQTHTVHVKVESAPYWQHVPNNTVAAEGESVRFECAAGGVPEPELQWFVNGVPIERAEPNPRRKVEGPVLSIETLAMSDTAVFQCNASNPHGYALRDFYVNVAGS